MDILQASFGDAGTTKPPSEPSAAKDDEKPAEETKPKPQASGWGDMFLKQNKAASQGSEAAAKAFLENPSMLARQSEPAEVSEPAKEGKPAEAAVQASGWGDMFLKKNKAASQTTDAATKSFLGDPSQPAASLAAGGNQCTQIISMAFVTSSVSSHLEYVLFAACQSRDSLSCHSHVWFNLIHSYSIHLGRRPSRIYDEPEF